MLCKDQPSILGLESFRNCFAEARIERLRRPRGPIPSAQVANLTVANSHFVVHRRWFEPWALMRPTRVMVPSLFFQFPIWPSRTCSLIIIKCASFLVLSDVKSQKRLSYLFPGYRIRPCSVHVAGFLRDRYTQIGSQRFLFSRSQKPGFVASRVQHLPYR